MTAFVEIFVITIKKLLMGLGKLPDGNWELLGAISTPMSEATKVQDGVGRRKAGWGRSRLLMTSWGCLDPAMPESKTSLDYFPLLLNLCSMRTGFCHQ